MARGTASGPRLARLDRAVTDPGTSRTIAANPAIHQTAAYPVDVEPGVLESPGTDAAGSDRTGSGQPQGLNAASFARRVLAWFDRHGRQDLPWQRDPSPYRVWVSEIMLQQTQVTTVIPYFERFMSRFPTIGDLARAKVDEVMALWAGLGYYARARNLHQAARLLWDRHGGRFPLTLPEVHELPGVGRSTAGAILSLACGQSHPILDGNVKRVLSRHRLIDGWPGQAQVLARLWALAEALTPAERAGAYNQAMMDLGATLCTRNRPSCDRCPLATDCLALAQREVMAYPRPRPPRALPRRAVQFLLLHNQQGEWLLERRPPSGIWGGLWSLPECAADEQPADWCRSHLGSTAILVENLPSRRHAFSHFELEMRPVRLLLTTEPATVADGNRRAWHRPEDLPDLGFPAPVLRLLHDLGVLEARTKRARQVTP